MNLKKVDKLERPTHRVIIDRRTHQPVGPLVPIYAEDWPYSKLAPSELLWRYMNFGKFEDLLVTSALYFSRPDKFTDPFEGRFSKANSSKMSLSDTAFHSAYNIAPMGKEMEASQEIIRKCVFVSCWHRDNKESRQMWDAYTSSSDSVVICTSAKALYTFLPDTIMKSPVKYHRDGFPRTAFGHSTLFFYKPSCYHFEREFRMLLTPGEHESIGFDEVGRRVPIKLKKIIHRVITHPRASAEFRRKVDSLMRVHLKHLRTENSILLP